METPEGRPDVPGDAELIARVRNGDLEAYGELYARHHHAAERMARQLVPANDADDLASDAFAKVWTRSGPAVVPTSRSGPIY